MGKVGKFELGKGVTFKLGMDLQKYLEDTISLKVRIPEGGAEVHHWIYEKAKRKHGLHPLVSITEAIEKDFDLVDADTQALLRIMGGANDSDEGSDDEVLMCNPRSDDPRTWKADDELEMFMEPVDTEDAWGRRWSMRRRRRLHQDGPDRAPCVRARRRCTRRRAHWLGRHRAPTPNILDAASHQLSR